MRDWYLVHPRGIVVRREGAAVSPPRTSTSPRSRSTKAAFIDAVSDAPGTASAVPITADATAFPEPLAVVTLREAFELLGEREFLLAGRATQLVEWADDPSLLRSLRNSDGAESLASAACGARSAGPGRISAHRSRNHRARAPWDEALLARNARSKMPFYSTLAGFVEIGESLERTVAREVHEEAGIEVDRGAVLRQSVVAVSALVDGRLQRRVESGRHQGRRSRNCGGLKWFRADALPLIPPRISIARRLIDAWTAEVLGAG